MPLLKIQTNHSLDSINTEALLAEASQLVATGLGKPEAYVMVVMEQRPQAMIFAGSTDPLAYLELKSIGLPEAKTGTLSQSLCQFMENKLGIPASRIYIEFADAPRAMWGWDSGTF
ncbi:MAG: phenylpyruvate tautomerase MIF-related protein [Gammaproteobacteria bacterium]|nr:phenylpyruvate tautomerase MIF-related protein [Gammaproteobacteria bacterium]